MNAEAGAFECPEGFELEEIRSQLYLEDLREDSELFLVRMPSDVEPNVVENELISLESQHVFHTKEGKILDSFVDCTELLHINLVLPSKIDGTLKEVKKPFKSSILIVERALDENEIILKTETQEDKISAGNISVDSNNFDSPSKPKKHKMKSKDGLKTSSSSIDIDTDIVPIETVYGDLDKLKINFSKQKKKKSIGFTKIKDEPHKTMDDYDFPSCSSQL